ncbi:MAG: nicotinamide-nucleotide amidohydrolase family protein, partial [Firmicutes bacterium]|nr:nicotinamide-nucleotide amidohydrolase family protein [Bacillota bacterium]
AVSEETAKEMAEGIARTSGADIGLATTGVAGPESSEGKPVGLVYIAIAYKGKTEVYTCHFVGKRNKIRERAAYTALNWLRKVINDEA